MKKKFVLIIFILGLFGTLYIKRLNHQIVFAQQQTCPRPAVPRVINGLISTTGSLPNNFGNDISDCVAGDTKALVPSSELNRVKIDNYNSLKAVFYDKSKYKVPPITNGQFPNVVTDESVFEITGDATYSSDIPRVAPAVFFIDGNLNIATNIKFGSTSSVSGAIFIVSGDINIAPNVTEIDGILFSNGTIYTEGAGCSFNPAASGTSQSLTINGSFISLNLNPTNQIKFCRSLVDNRNPSENFVYQPKFLPIMRDIFSEPLTIFSEKSY